MKENKHFSNIIANFLSGLYILSFFLPSVKIRSKYGSWVESRGFETFSGCFGDFDFISVILGIFSLGNVFMVLAMISFFTGKRDPRNFVKIGLTVQSGLCLLTWLGGSLIFTGYHFGIGYYFWVVSQIGMGLLLWLTPRIK